MTPESAGATFDGRVMLGTSVSTKVVVVQDPTTAPPTLGTADLMAGPSVAATVLDVGLLDWLDLSLGTFGLRAQVLGSARGPGHKLSLFVGQKSIGTEDTTGIAKSQTDTIGNEAVVSYGYRMNDKAMVYLNLAGTSYHIDTMVKHTTTDTSWDYDDGGTQIDAIVGLSLGGEGFHVMIEGGPRQTTLVRDSASYSTVVGGLALGYRW